MDEKNQKSKGMPRSVSTERKGRGTEVRAVCGSDRRGLCEVVGSGIRVSV